MEPLSPVHRDIVLFREAILQHEHYYYVLKQPIITDLDFDIFKQRLIELEEANPDFFCPTSPIARYENLGKPDYKEVEHVRQMLDYASGTGIMDVHDFKRTVDRGKLSEKVSYVFEPIIDGVDVELVYEQGVFERAVLRVDGNTGIDITQNVRILKGFPLRLYEDERPCPRLLSIHAIFFVSEEELYANNFNQTREGERTFLTIGEWVRHLLQNDDFRVVTRAPLKYMCIDILHGDEDMVTYAEIREALKQWRLPINPVISDVEGNVLKAVKYRDELLEKGVKLPYRYTGVAIKAYETCIRDELGRSRTTIRWALHLKYPPIKRNTRILEINFDVDTRGILNATARTRPIYLLGMNVNVARFEDVSDILENDIRVGDVAQLERDGERLPFVRQRIINTKRSGPRVPTRVPTHCPACNSELERRRGILRCVNKYACPAQMNLRFMHFIGEDGFNIRHLGPARCQHLLDHGLITDFADLFKLKWQDLVGLPYVKEGRARLIVEEIRRSRRIRLRKFLFALGIPEVGHIVSGELERVFHSLDVIQMASYRQLLRLRGVGEKAAQSIYFYFREPKNLALISKLLDNGVVPYTKSMVGHRRKMFYGKLVILAGTLRKYRQKELKELIESEGGIVRRNMVKSADLLIYGQEPGAKLRLAQKYGVRTWNEVQLLRNLLQHGVG